MKGFRIGVVLLVAVVIAFSVLAPAALAKHGNPRVIPPNATPGGMTYGDWGAAWWQWAMAIPKDANPLNDPTGANAENGQSGEVWFLGGTVSSTPTGPSTYLGMADRTATVPVGKMVFFPIINVEASTAEGNGETEAELASLCDWYVQHVTPTAVTIDGRSLRNLTAYRAQSSMFPLWWPADAAIDGMPLIDQPTNSVSDGFWIMLAPLRAGKHVFHWEGETVFSIAAGDDFDATWAQDITYHLTVR